MAGSQDAKAATDALVNLGDLGVTLIGSDSSSSGVLDSLLTKEGATKEYLDLSPVAIERIIQQILGGTEGLASIFSGEKATGLYGSTAAAQASGDLVAQLAGEIAKLTAPKITETTAKEALDQTTETEEEKAGLLDVVGDKSGGVGEYIKENPLDVIYGPGATKGVKAVGDKGAQFINWLGGG